MHTHLMGNPPFLIRIVAISPPFSQWHIGFDFFYCIRVVGISNTEVKNLCALYLSHLTKRGGFVKIDYFLKAATSDFISYNGNRAIFIY